MCVLVHLCVCVLVCVFECVCVCVCFVCVFIRVGWWFICIINQVYSVLHHVSGDRERQVDTGRDTSVAVEVYQVRKTCVNRNLQTNMMEARENGDREYRHKFANPL